MYRHLFTLITVLLALESYGASDDSENWDVSIPPGPWRDITIETDTTTWSFVDVNPNGTRVVFDMLGDLYSVPLSGGTVTALTGGIEWNFQPTFSPDGKRIAFVSDRDGNDNIWVMDIDGSNVTQVTKERKHNLHNPAWTPDSQWIAVRKGTVSGRSIPSGEIWMYHINGGSGIEVVDNTDGKRAQKSIAEPAFSPDGNYLYYSQDTTSGWVWQYNKDSTGEIFAIRRLDLTTGETDTITGGPGGAVRPTPSPDGTKLAFVKRLPDFNSAIVVRDLASGMETVVYDSLERDEQETAGSHGNTTAFEWLPNGRDLVFWTAGRIHRLNTETGDTKTLPIQLSVTKKVRDTVRFPVEVAPDSVDSKMLRWAQLTPKGKSAIFGSMGHLYQSAITSNGAQKPKRLTRQNAHFEYWPALSSDGQQVVYTSWDDQSLGRVKLVSARGGRSKTLVATPGHYVEPQFSPDGKSVVYRKTTGGYLLSPLWSVDPGIYRVATQGGTPVKISNTGHHPAFTADGRRILFTTRGEKGLELHSVDLNGLDKRVIAHGEKVTSYAVSPDGNWLAFTEHFRVYVMPLTVTGKPMMAQRTGGAIPVRGVSDRAGEFLHWSADSQALHWSNGPALFTRNLHDAFTALAPDKDQADKTVMAEPNIQSIDLSFSVAADKPSTLLALVGGTVVTMQEADSEQQVLSDGVILIEENRITAVGIRGEIDIPSNAEIVDVTGKTVIPGLIDAHAHGGMGSEEIIPQQNWMQLSNLAFGVTSIHDPSNDTSEIFTHAEMQRAGLILGPRTWSTGTILYGANAPGATTEVHSLEDAEFHIERLRSSGAISVKSYNQLARSARQQIIEAADQQGIMVVPEGGMKFQHNMNHLIDGHTSIEHSLPIAEIYDDVVQLWSQVGTGYVPTFVVSYGGLMGEEYWYDRTDVWLNERLMRYSPRQFVEPRSMRRPKAPDHHYNHINVARTAKKLRDHGVRVMIGAHGQREGLAPHWEMWMMVQGGFSPWEALRGATSDAAIHLGMDADIGSIAEGKLADLAIIDGNVLEDIRLSEYVSHTVLNGRLYSTDTMNEIVTGDRPIAPLFFLQPGGQQLPAGTLEALEAKRARHHWRH
ncbi:MAG: amidohydrolase family protein [Luminiphilus sp.]|nr:amidohydrolase family protein [Luminiphilus sp.]